MFSDVFLSVDMSKDIANDHSPVQDQDITNEQTADCTCRLIGMIQICTVSVCSTVLLQQKMSNFEPESKPHFLQQVSPEGAV